MTDIFSKPEVVGELRQVINEDGEVELNLVTPASPDPDDYEVEHYKLNQAEYDLIHEQARTVGKQLIGSTVVTIGRCVDVSSCKLADTPHHFEGDNILNEVPAGSYVGDRSVVAATGPVDSVSFGLRTFFIGEENEKPVVFNNCSFDTGCEMFGSVELNHCEAMSFFKAKNATLNNTLIGPLGNIESINDMNNSILMTGTFVKHYEKIGDDNAIVAGVMPNAPVIGENNKLSRIEPTPLESDLIVSTIDVKTPSGVITKHTLPPRHHKQMGNVGDSILRAERTTNIEPVNKHEQGVEHEESPGPIGPGGF